MSLKRSSSKLGIITFVTAAGALIGSQIFHPTKRIIETIGGLILVYLIWNFSTLSALWLILIIYPFPFVISTGNSTFVFVVILFIIFLIRVSARRSTLRFDKQFSLPIILMVMSYILSFYNIKGSSELIKFGLIHTVNFFAAVLFFYLIINFVTDERKLYTTVRISMITCTLVMLSTLLELLFPGKEFIPGWLYTQHKIQLVMKDVRMGGAIPRLRIERRIPCHERPHDPPPEHPRPQASHTERVHVPPRRGHRYALHDNNARSVDQSHDRLDLHGLSIEA